MRVSSYFTPLLFLQELRSTNGMMTSGMTEVIKIMLPISFFFISIFNFIVYAWVGVYPGIVFTLIFLTCSVALFLYEYGLKMTTI